MTSAKITTCCYCGSRAALVLAGDQRHELACGTCGAPLHEMHALQVASPTTTDRPWSSKPPKKSKKRKAPPHPMRLPDIPVPRSKTPSLSFGKRRLKKKLTRKLIKKAFDAIDDVFG